MLRCSLFNHHLPPGDHVSFADPERHMQLARFFRRLTVSDRFVALTLAQRQFLPLDCKVFNTARWSSSMRTLGCLHLGVPLTLGRVSAPRFSAPMWGTVLRLRPPTSPLRRGWCLPTGSGDLNVAGCMTPKVRFLDGVVCVLLCVGLNPCRLHVVLLS